MRNVSLVSTVALLMSVFLAIPSRADDATDRRARVALALAAAGLNPGTPTDPECKVVGRVDHEKRAECALKQCGPGGCECEATGICHCEFGKCRCCEKDLPWVGEQLDAGRAKRLPVVVYYGCKGHCIDGALSARQPYPEKDQIVVYAPVVWQGGPTNWPIATLPADAGRKEIAAAVTKAKAYLDRFYAPAPAAAVAGPVVGSPYYLPAAPACPSCSGGNCPLPGRGFQMVYPPRR